MAKIIGVVPVAILGDPTKSNMNDYFKVGNNYAKRVLESACVPIGMVPVDYWLTEEALDLCDGFIVQGGDEFYAYHFQVIHHAISHGKLKLVYVVLIVERYVPYGAA